jgi:hypothetical protein
VEDTSFPRRRESSKNRQPAQRIKILVLTRYAGFFNHLDSRLRGNDGQVVLMNGE